jgi:hypothetical protein
LIGLLHFRRNLHSALLKLVKQPAQIVDVGKGPSLLQIYRLDRQFCGLLGTETQILQIATRGQ